MDWRPRLLALSTSLPLSYGSSIFLRVDEVCCLSIPLFIYSFLLRETY